MKTYIYESIPESCCDDPEYFEFEQSDTDAPLVRHPESGVAVRRVMVAGRDLVKDAGDCSGKSGCC